MIRTGTYSTDVHDGTVHLFQNLCSALGCDARVILQSLQQIVLDVGDIDEIRNVLHEALPGLPAHIWSEN
jgi:hypothetical protein